MTLYNEVLKMLNGIQRPAAKLVERRALGTAEAVMLMHGVSSPTMYMQTVA